MIYCIQIKDLGKILTLDQFVEYVREFSGQAKYNRKRANEDLCDTFSLDDDFEGSIPSTLMEPDARFVRFMKRKELDSQVDKLLK